MAATAPKSEPKYCVIRDSIRDDIQNKKFGHRLPSCRELSRIYNASYLTVNKAVKMLESEGYLKLVQGKGMFPRIPHKRRERKTKIRKVGFLLPATSGHIYQNLLSTFIWELERYDITPLPLALPESQEELLMWQREELIKKYYNQGIDSFVIDGFRHFQFRMFKKNYEQELQTNYVIRFDSDITFPGANTILSDFRKGGFMAAECLIKNSRTKIGFLSVEGLDENQMNQNGCSRKQYEHVVMEGIKDAIIRNGLDSDGNFPVFRSALGHFDELPGTQIEDFIKSGGNGLICNGDSRALPVYRLLSKMGSKAGKDLGIIGYFNTPWTEVFEPPLTSISICEKEIAKVTVKAIVENWREENVLVKPKLIKRGSE